MTDFYQILGIDKSASDAEIKKAYRSMAMKHHPDRGGDKNKFQEIQQAYDTLSDPQKRSEYDNPQQFNNGGFHFNGAEGFEQFFHHFGPGFGEAFGFRRPAVNRTIQLQTIITLEEAFYGKEVVASITLPNGRDQAINVTIPKGMHSVTTLKLSGIGDDSVASAPRGDIHLTVHIEDHPRFRRQGDDLITDVEISCIDAMLGGKINVVSIDGKNLETTIPAGVQHDNILNLAGYGMPNFNHNARRGRLLIKLKLIVPTLTSEQQNILKSIKP